MLTLVRFSNQHHVVTSQASCQGFPFKTILIESEHVFAPRIPISKRYVSTVISFSRK